jgi:hypothetical protein
LCGVIALSVFSIIKIDKYTVRSDQQEIKRVKGILDKLEIPHIVDDISFHNTSEELNRMRTLHNTNVWKVEKDGSISLSNRFGHNGRLAYRQLSIASIAEFQFANLCDLCCGEGEILAELICKFENLYEMQIPKERQKAILP